MVLGGTPGPFVSLCPGNVWIWGAPVWEAIVSLMLMVGTIASAPTGSILISPDNYLSVNYTFTIK